MSIVEIYQKEAHFEFSIESDDFDKEHVTSEVILANIPWKVKVSKRQNDGEDVIDLHLVCSPAIQPNTLEWFYEAKMTVTLCPAASDQQPYQKSLAKVTFKNGKESHGLTGFIKFADLKPYTQNGLIYFEVRLSVGPLKVRDKTQIEQKRSIFQFTLDDVSKLKKHSVDVSVGGNKWSVFLDKRIDSLGFFLRDERNSQNSNWTWNANYSLKLLSFDDNIDSLIRKLNQTFHLKGQDWGFRCFISWKDLMDPAKKYVQDDKAIFEVDLEVSPAKPLWNIDQRSSNPEDEIFECSICLQNIVGREPVSTKCGHIFCKECISRFIQEKKKCPNCNADAILLDLRSIYP